MLKKIGVMTTGGDAPGMNAAIRAAVRTAISNGVEVVGIEEGYSGLLKNLFRPMDSRSVSNIIGKGGTILKTVRSKDFRDKSKRQAAYRLLHAKKIDGLAIIGGDGSRMGAYTITKETGIPTAFIPASIDNDVYGTEYTVGFDTAVNVALDAIDRIRDTADSHERVFIVEVMGREHGFLTLEAGITGGAEIILLPEFKKDINVKRIGAKLDEGIRRGKSSSIIVMAEGAGSGFEMARQISEETGLDVRCSVLGYIQRGGSPTARSRKLGLEFGYEAVMKLLRMKKGQSVMAGIINGKLKISDMKDVIGRERKIDASVYKMNEAFVI